MLFEQLFFLVSACISPPKNHKFSLPEDLVCHILKEYLPDHPHNRLISKRAREILDRKYQSISGDASSTCWRNVEAVMKLRSRKFHSNLSEYLRDEDRSIRRTAVKLIKELKLSYTLELPVLIRLLMESRSIEEFYTILSVAKYNNYFSLISSNAYQRLPRSEQLALEEKRFNLLRKYQVKRSVICYYRAHSIK